MTVLPNEKPVEEEATAVMFLLLSLTVVLFPNKNPVEGVAGVVVAISPAT